MQVKQNILKISAFLALVVIINVLASSFYKRIDLTADKRFTLSPYTRDILKKLPGKIHVTVYLDGRKLPVEFKHFRLAIKDLLDEFKLVKGRDFTYDFVDPVSDRLSREEKQKMYEDFRSLGIVPLIYQETSQGEAKQIQIFPAAKVSYVYPQGDSILRQEVGINLLNKDPNFQPASEQNINNSIQTLEYKFVNSLVKFFTQKPKTVAFIEGHGELPEIFVLDFERELSQYYNVKRGVIGGKYGILDSFDVIIVAKPLKKFSKADKFVIDQYIMKGGKVLWLLDGVNVDMDSIIYYDKAFAFPAQVEQVGLEDMLFKYGVRVNSDLVQDMFCSTIRLVGQSPNGQEQYHTFLWFYFPVLVSHNNHVINRYIDYIHTVFVSSIDTVGKRPGLKRKVLLTTGEYSRILPVNFPWEITLDEVNTPPAKEAFNKKYVPVAVLLEGKFPSAFSGRIVRDILPRGQKKLDTSVNTKMIVVSDGDIIRNEVTSDGRIMPLGFDRYSGVTFNGNKQFLINAVNYLADDQGLMKLRSRQFTLRTLDKAKVDNYYYLWVVLSVILPLLVLALLGFAISRLKFG